MRRRSRVFAWLDGVSEHGVEVGGGGLALEAHRARVQAAYAQQRRRAPARKPGAQLQLRRA
eukprot:2396562-Pleurochrysis_carterae.AAC.2